MAAPVAGINAKLGLQAAEFMKTATRAQRHLNSQAAMMRKHVASVDRATRGLNKSFGKLKAGIGTLVGALAVRQLTKFTQSAIDNTDSLAKQAKQLQISAAELQRYRIEGDLAGVATSKLESGIGAFVKRVGELKAGTGTLVTILDKSNVALKNQLVAVNSTGEGVRIMLKAIREAPTAFEKQALSAAAFGRQAGQAMVLLADTAGDLNKEMLQTVTISDKVLKAGERLQDQFTLLKTSFSAGFDSAIIEGLSGQVNATADAMGKARLVGEQFGAAVGASMRAIASAAEIVGRNLRQIAAAIAALVAFKAATIFLGIAAAVRTYAVEARAATIATGSLNAVLRLNPIGLIATAVGVAAGAFILLGGSTADAASSQNLYNEAMRGAQQVLGTAIENARLLRTERVEEEIATTRAALAVERLTLAEAERNAQTFARAAAADSVPGPGRERLSTNFAEKAAAAAGIAKEAAARVADLEKNLAALGKELESPTGAAAGLAGISGATGDATDAFEKFKVSLVVTRDQQKALAAAHKKGAAAVKLVQAAVKIHNFEIAKGITLTGDQRRELALLILKEQEHRGSIEKTIRAQQEAQQASKDAAAAEAARVVEQRQAIVSLFDTARENIQNSMGDAFESILVGGVDTFAELANSAKRIMARLAAEVATLLVFKPAIGGELRAFELSDLNLEAV